MAQRRRLPLHAARAVCVDPAHRPRPNVACDVASAAATGGRHHGYRPGRRGQNRCAIILHLFSTDGNSHALRRRTACRAPGRSHPGATPGPASADEGMWTFNDFPRSVSKKPTASAPTRPGSITSAYHRCGSRGAVRQASSRPPAWSRPTIIARRAASSSFRPPAPT